MTALNRDNIPANINTLEGLMAWCLATYNAAYGGLTYAETALNDSQRIAQYSTTPINSAINGSNQALIGRVVIPLDANFATSSTPLWDSAIEHSQQAILPAGYTV